MKKQHVKLTETDRIYLETLVSKGDLKAKAYRRALGLLELHRGKTYATVSETLQVGIATLSGRVARYQKNGLKALEDKPRPGRPIEISGEERAKITALACSTPPEGYARWSLRLLAEKVVELDYCEHISHTAAGKILKKTNSNRI